MSSSSAPLVARTGSTRALPLLIGLTSLSLTVISVIDNTGEVLSIGTSVAMVLLTALGFLAGLHPRAAGTGMVLVVAVTVLSGTFYVGLSLFVILLPVAVLASRGNLRSALVLTVMDIAVVSLPTDIKLTAAEFVASVLLWALLLGLSILVGLLVHRARVRRRLMKAAFERARAEERRRLSVELHDSIARLAAGIAVQAEITRLAHRDDPDLSEALAKIGDQCRVLTADLYTINQVLRTDADGVPDLDDPMPLPLASLASPAEQLREETAKMRAEGLEVSVHGVVPAGLEPARRAVLSRVISEGCASVLRHASRQEPVRVLVDVEDDVLDLVLVNGVPEGRCASAPAVRSLEALRQELAGIGGTLTSAPNGDMWVLHLTMPMTASVLPAPSHS